MGGGGYPKSDATKLHVVTPVDQGLSTFPPIRKFLEKKDDHRVHEKNAAPSTFLSWVRAAAATACRFNAAAGVVGTGPRSRELLRVFLNFTKNERKNKNKKCCCSFPASALVSRMNTQRTSLAAVSSIVHFCPLSYFPVFIALPLRTIFTVTNKGTVSRGILPLRTKLPPPMKLRPPTTLRISTKKMHYSQ